jgi:hypothetical protein
MSIYSGKQIDSLPVMLDHLRLTGKHTAMLQIKTSVEDCVDTLIHKLSLINYRQAFLGSKYG